MSNDAPVRGLLDVIERTRSRCDAAEKRLEDERREITVQIRSAYSAGYTIAEIARAAGWSRKRIYDLLGDLAPTTKDRP